MTLAEEFIRSLSKKQKKQLASIINWTEEIAGFRSFRGDAAYADLVYCFRDTLEKVKD